jgi:hypothetical protein
VSSPAAGQRDGGPTVPEGNEVTTAAWSRRLKRAAFPLIAAGVALAAFVVGVLRSGPPPPATQETALSSSTSAERKNPAVPPGRLERTFERTYREAAILGGPRSAHPFVRSLFDVAAGPADRIYALGDGQVRVFDPEGTLLGGWKVADEAECLAVDGGGRVLVAGGERLAIYDAEGKHAALFSAAEPGRPASITAVAVFGAEILVADASARIIRRMDASGRSLGVIGRQGQTGGFMLPNNSLDVAVDPKGVVYANDSGRHQVTAWSLDGSPVGRFGRFGMERPEDFVGCCNPVNLALTPDGNIVTAEKMVARVKVYRADGTLLAVIGPEHFDPQSVHIPVAVDSAGRILAADPKRRQITIFAPATESAAPRGRGGDSPQPVSRELECP